MPLVKRSVSPSSLCRDTIPNNIKNELECVTNNTLSGVIFQLSSLSMHAEDVFGELFTEANSFYSRASRLQDRIDNLSVKVTQLDSTVEEVSLHDINMRKAFQSSGITDQQVVSRESLPQTLISTYNRANKPPPLQELNQFRDDGRDALKIYTDPDYFFNLWRDAMQKEMRDAKEKRREQRKKEKRANPNYREKNKVKMAIPKSKLKAQQMKGGVEFADTTKPQPVSQPMPVSNDVTNSHSPSPQSDTQTDYNHMPPPPDVPYHDIQSTIPPPPGVDYVASEYPTPPPPSVNHLPAPPAPPTMNGGIPDYPELNLPPPNSNIPPPPPAMNGIGVPPPPPAPVGIPPPPPPGAVPPPPPNAPSPPASSGLANALQKVTLKQREEPVAPVQDDRSNLLLAIRDGINLKKVEQREKTAAATSSGGGNDVASILARRIAVEFSDSESDSFSDDDDNDWD